MAFNFDQVTPQLYVGTQPAIGDYPALRKLGIALVINMRAESAPLPDPGEPPIELLWLRTVDHPFFPLSIDKLVRGVEAALPVLAAGKAVYTHCAYGRHRGPAMAAAILIAQGHTLEEACRLIRRARPQAHPCVWYMRWRLRRFERRWHNT